LCLAFCSFNDSIRYFAVELQRHTSTELMSHHDIGVLYLAFKADPSIFKAKFTFEPNAMAFNLNAIRQFHLLFNAKQEA